MRRGKADGIKMRDRDGGAQMRPIAMMHDFVFDDRLADVYAGGFFPASFQAAAALQDFVGHGRGGFEQARDRAALKA
jgi:hypothetical protein